MIAARDDTMMTNPIILVASSANAMNVAIAKPIKNRKHISVSIPQTVFC